MHIVDLRIKASLNHWKMLSCIAPTP